MRMENCQINRLHRITRGCIEETENVENDKFNS